MGTDVDVENIESSIEACRTCGTYFLGSSNLLRQIFDSASNDNEMEHIRSQLKAWDVHVSESDIFTKYICTGCIHEFQRIFKFRRTCRDTQTQFSYFQNMRAENIKVKTEITDPGEDNSNNFAFIYVDDISGDEDGETSVFFNFSHIPIKIEKDAQEAPPTVIEIPSYIPKESSAGAFNGNNVTIAPTNIPNNFEIDINNIKKEKEVATTEKTNTVTKDIKCNFCSYATHSENALINHIQLYHEPKDHECHICGKKFNKTTFMRFKYHLKWHKISKHIKCAQCGFYCASKQILSEHRRAVHAKVPCEKCGKSFTAKKLKCHLREHHMDNDVVCTICEEAFSTELELQQHCWRQHNNESSETIDEAHNDNIDADTIVVLCATCSATFNSTEDLADHVRRTHIYNNENKESKDSYVDYNARTDESFGSSEESDCSNSETESLQPEDIEELEEDEEVEEVEEVEEEEEEEHDESELTISEPVETVFKFQCSDCYQVFETVEALQEHHLIHSKVRPSFKCSICNKSFELKFSLNRHLKKHKAPPL